MFALALCGAVPAHAAEPPTELALVQLYLEGPLGEASLRSVRDRTRAAATAPALLANPELEARREEARGPAGATTEAVGGSLTVGLGMSSLADRRAAGLRGEAAPHWGQAARLDAVCAIRRQSADLWAATRAAEATDASHERLERLQATLAALAEAGEASGYERDRSAMALAAHDLAHTQARGALDALRAHLSALVGQPVHDVGLEPLPALPDRAASAEVSAHPELIALTLEQSAQARAQAAARRSALPDLRVSGGARWDAPPGGEATPGYEVGGALEIPIFDWSRESIRSATAERSAAEALLLSRRAGLQAEAETAWLRATELAKPPISPDPAALWTASLDRYTAGAASLDELLQIAESVEEATRAAIERERLLRQAHLDLACATGQFPNPAFQDLLQDSPR